MGLFNSLFFFWTFWLKKKDFQEFSSKKLKKTKMSDFFWQTKFKNSDKKILRFSEIDHKLLEFMQIYSTIHINYFTCSALEVKIARETSGSNRPHDSIGLTSCHISVDMSWHDVCLRRSRLAPWFKHLENAVFVTVAPTHRCAIQCVLCQSNAVCIEFRSLAGLIELRVRASIHHWRHFQLQNPADYSKYLSCNFLSVLGIFLYK